MFEGKTCSLGEAFTNTDAEESSVKTILWSIARLPKSLSPAQDETDRYHSQKRNRPLQAGKWSLSPTTASPNCQS